MQVAVGPYPRSDGIFESDLALRRIFFFSRFVGVFPFNDNYRPTLGNVLWSCCLLMSMMLVSFFSHFFFGFSKVHERRTFKIVIANSANVLSLLTVVRNEYYVRSLREGLRCVERKLLAAGITWRWRRSRVFLYRTHVVFFIVLGVNMAFRMSFHSFSSNLAHFLSYVSTFPILLTIIGQFTSLQDVISAFFDALPSISDPRDLAITMESLRYVAECSQRIYGLQLLLYLTCLFSFVVSNTYYEVISDYGFSNSFVHVLWLVAFLVSIFDIVTTCNNTVKKVGKYKYNHTT